MFEFVDEIVVLFKWECGALPRFREDYLLLSWTYWGVFDANFGKFSVENYVVFIFLLLFSLKGFFNDF